MTEKFIIWKTSNGEVNTGDKILLGIVILFLVAMSPVWILPYIIGKIGFETDYVEVKRREVEN